MKTPYTTNIKEFSIPPQFLEHDKLPEWCIHPLKYSQENILYQIENLSVLRQCFSYKPFFVDLIKTNADRDFEFNFEIHSKQAVMFFMLEGIMEFYDHSKELIFHLPKKNFLMSYFDSGSYDATFHKGKAMVFVITIDSAWLEKISSEYKNIDRFITEYKNTRYPYLALYQDKMDNSILRSLGKVYHSHKIDIGLFDALLRENITLMLIRYDKLLTDYWLAFEIREYIKSHIKDENLDMDLLSDRFNVSKRVLSYVFKKIFNQNILPYINDIRMELSINLMTNENMTISQLYMLVGYKDEGTFRYHYNRRKKKLNVKE